MSLAWHTAMMQRMDAKKVPKLEKLMIPDKPKEPRRQTGEEQMAIVQDWLASRPRKSNASSS